MSDCSAISQVDLDDINNHLPLEEVFIGHRTSDYLKDNVSLSISDVKNFKEVCLAWWHTAVKEAIERLPLTHSVLNNIHWLEPGLQQYDMHIEVLAVADCLPQVVKLELKPSQQEEFMGYCTFRPPDSVKTQNAVDKYWHFVGEMCESKTSQDKIVVLLL